MKNTIIACVAVALVVAVVLLLTVDHDAKWQNARTEDRKHLASLDSKLDEIERCIIDRMRELETSEQKSKASDRERLDSLDSKLGEIELRIMDKMREHEENEQKSRASDRERIDSFDGKLCEIERFVVAVLTGKESTLTQSDKTVVAKTSLELQLAAVASCLEKARNLRENEGMDVEEELPIASILLQTATRELGRALALDAKLLSPDGMKKLKEAAAEIAQEEEEFNRMKSSLITRNIHKEFEEIDKLLKANIDHDPDRWADKAYSKLIAEVDKRVFNIQMAIPRIYHHELRREVEEKLRGINEKYIKLLKARIRRYQEYAIHYCNLAFKQFQQWKIVTDDNATALITGYLIDIDTSLLAPDVARLYDEVLGKFLAELGWKKRTALEIEISQYAKKTLEDF